MKQVLTNITNAYLLNAQEILKLLEITADKGLSSKEAQLKYEKFGPNSIPDGENFRLAKLFFKRFKDILIIILLAAAIISLLLGRVVDATIISLVITVDVCLSFLQIWRTERTLAKMRLKVRDKSTVIRDGVVRSILSEKLVVGDIIKIRAGENVPADARIIKSEGMRVKESLLTGESADVMKVSHKLTRRTALANRKNILFAGTTVVNGSALAVVVATGTRTEFGKIAQMLKTRSSPASPLRAQLQKQGLKIGWLIIAAVALIAVVQLLKGYGLSDTLRTSITLVVSAIPEDLSMILTIALTVGVVRIFRRKGLIRELSAGETLGSTTVICTDKTGTLTAGKMKAVKLDFLQGSVLTPNRRIGDEPFHKLALNGFVLSSSAQKIKTDTGIKYFGSATERTSLAFVESFGLKQEEISGKWRQRDIIPFSPSYKYRATLVDHPTQSTQTLFVTGAPDILLEKSHTCLDPHNEQAPLTDDIKKDYINRIDHLAQQGQRLIAVAIKRHLTQDSLSRDNIQDLMFLGVLVITDPIRPDITKSIQETLAAGVQIKLITGDHSVTAKAIARKVGLATSADNIWTGDDLHGMSDKELQDNIDHITVFARVEPLDKQRIVRALQNKGHIVAMTGDGVNDTVALKSADIGVAMESGSDIAKESADLILLNNSFTTIVSAIYEGRVIRDNVRKVLGFLLSTNAAEVSIFIVSLIAGLPLPLSPAQILWINLVTDGTSDIALSLEPAEKNIMTRHPEKPDSALINKTMLLAQIILPGIIMTAATMGMYWYSLRVLNLDLNYARTVAFSFLAITSLLSAWSYRSLRESIYKRGLWQNKWVPISAAFSICLHLTSIYIPWFNSFFDTVPLNVYDWFFIIVIAIFTVILIDLRKILIRHHKEEHSQPVDLDPKPSPAKSFSSYDCYNNEK